MPPNKKGGKNYKKGKHADDNPIIFERQPDQMYGRIIRLLGGCNAIVYCNDNRERLCHIRGSMRKKTWISVGDIVLISTRDLARRGDSVTERGDICAKYDPSVFERLKDRDRDINERLFTLIEKTDNAPNKNGRVPDLDDGFGFVFDRTENEICSGDESDESDQPKIQAPKPVATKPQVKPAVNSNSSDSDSDINIDDI
jgi:translation initiation factor 1A